MSTVALWLSALPFMLVLGLIAWAIATARCNAGLVDIFWSMFFLLGALLHFAAGDAARERAWLVLALVALWALRLAGDLAARNWNAPKFRCYRLMPAAVGEERAR